MSNGKEIAVVFKAGEAEVKLTPSIVQEYVVGSQSARITLPEFKFFTEICKTRGLNPFLKEVYCVKYSDKEPAAIVVSKNVYIERANNHPAYNGKKSGIFVLNKDGQIEKRDGTLRLDGEHIIGGWCEVYRKDRVYPEYKAVSFSEVAGKKADGSLNKTWAKQPATMVEKVATVRALREAFPETFGCLYSAEEFPSVDIPSADFSAEITDAEYEDTPTQYDPEEAPRHTVNLDEL